MKTSRSIFFPEINISKLDNCREESFAVIA